MTKSVSGGVPEPAKIAALLRSWLSVGELHYCGEPQLHADTSDAIAALERPRPALPSEPPCNRCGGQGWYPVANHWTGEPEQEQCAQCLGTGAVGVALPAPSTYELSDDDVAVFLSVHRAEIENDGSPESAVREGWKVVTANRVNQGAALPPQTGNPAPDPIGYPEAERLNEVPFGSPLRAPQGGPGLYGFLAVQGDLLAQHIRTVDGSHSLGAGALAERLVECGWRHSLNVGAGSGAETPPQPEIPK